MKLEYAVRIERLAENDGGGYLATVPDLPGCMSDGETPEEAAEHFGWFAQFAAADLPASSHGAPPVLIRTTL